METVILYFHSIPFQSEKYFGHEFMVYPKLCLIMNLLSGVTLSNGYIDVGRNVLVTTIRCWWRLWPSFYISVEHQYYKHVTNIEILSTPSQNRHQRWVTNITITLFNFSDNFPSSFKLSNFSQNFPTASKLSNLSETFQLQKKISNFARFFPISLGSFQLR